MKTAAQVKPKQPMRSRAPTGVDSIQRINLALMPDEKDELHRRAKLDGRTFSAMARLYMIDGMKADKRFDEQPKGEAA